MENNSVPMPRIQGSAYEREDKRFGWEMKISFGDAEPLFLATPDDHKGFSSRDEAVADLKEQLKSVVRTMEETLGTKATGFYNLKTNMMEKTLEQM
jgi:hypothetical protein